MSSENRPILYLVDDDSDQLFLLRHAAERSGEYGEIRAAVDAHLAYEELLEMAQAARPLSTVVITDWKMPNLSGAELACALRAHPGLNEIPVIALSGSYAEADRAEALDCGCKAFFQKPDDFHQLTALLGEICRIYYTACTRIQA